MSRTQDLTGKRFHRLIAIKPHHLDKHNQWHWLFKCSCGGTLIANNQNVKRGATKSCGCLNDEKRKEKWTRHGLHNDRFYHIWENIKQRCLNPKATGYKKYGGKGIAVCKRWLLFENFQKDMYSMYTDHVFVYGTKNTQIDRINCAGDYTKRNCRWVTLKEQANNRSKNV